MEDSENEIKFRKKMKNYHAYDHLAPTKKKQENVKENLNKIDLVRKN